MDREQERCGAPGAFAVLGAVLLVLSGCREVQDQSPRGSGGPPPPAPPARIVRPAPSSPFACQDLRPSPGSEQELVPETISLRPLGDGKKVYFSKVGVVVTFDREEFLAVARCRKLEDAVRYVEAETGFTERAPIMDAFQAYYVAAALLDLGRADVRLPDEGQSRASIARDAWAEASCNGQCRAFGRKYRLSPQDRRAFLKVSDLPARPSGGP